MEKSKGVKMITCEGCEELAPICDFCKYFVFDKAWCLKHKKETYPCEGCKDYVCLWGEK